MILFINLNERWKREFLEEKIRKIDMPYEFSGPGFVHERNEAPLIHQYNLLRRLNVVFTPHVAFNSREAVQRILKTTVENITAFVAGTAQNTV